MTIDRYQEPGLLYGYIPNYTGLGRQFRLRPGQLFSAQPRMADVPQQTYFDCGVTNVQGSPDPDASIQDYSRFATCIGNEFLRNTLPNKPMSEWDQSDCEGTVNNYFGSLGGGWGHTTSQFFEAYKEALPWKVENGSQQQRWIEAAIQAQLDPKGGVYAGEYNGSARFTYQQAGAEYFRLGLTVGGNVALQTMMDFAAFGDAFYTQEGWRRRHGSINIYYIGEHDLHAFISERLVTIQMDILAKQYVGTDRSTTAFAWSGQYQPISPSGFSLQLARSVAGGTLYSNSFPSCTNGAMIGLFFLAIAQNLHLFSWEDNIRFGRAMSVITDQQNEFAHYEGDGSVTRASFAYKYTNDRPVASPNGPQGGQDLAFVACDMLSEAAKHGGYGNIWTPHRVGNGNFTDANAGDYLTERYVNNQGYSRLGGNGNERWYFYMNMGLPTGQWESVEAKLQPGLLNFDAEGSTPHLFFINL